MCWAADARVAQGPQCLCSQGSSWPLGLGLLGAREGYPSAHTEPPGLTEPQAGCLTVTSWSPQSPVPFTSWQGQQALQSPAHVSAQGGRTRRVGAASGPATHTGGSLCLSAAQVEGDGHWPGKLARGQGIVSVDDTWAWVGCVPTVPGEQRAAPSHRWQWQPGAAL